jgi:hypothetical protein
MRQRHAGDVKRTGTSETSAQPTADVVTCPPKVSRDTEAGLQTVVACWGGSELPTMLKIRDQYPAVV